MAHPRELIRKQAVARLLNKTSAGASVYASRIEPFISNDWEDQLPAIVVYTQDESGEIWTAAPREYRRSVELVVEIHASGDSTLDDTLDTVARQVEIELLKDDTLGGTVEDLRYARTRMVLRDEGQTLLGGCRISFEADYIDAHPNADFNASLRNLNTVATDFSLNNEQTGPADRAQSIIEGLNP